MRPKHWTSPLGLVSWASGCWRTYRSPAGSNGWHDKLCCSMRSDWVRWIQRTGLIWRRRWKRFSLVMGVMSQKAGWHPLRDLSFGVRSIGSVRQVIPSTGPRASRVAGVSSDFIMWINFCDDEWKTTWVIRVGWPSRRRACEDSDRFTGTCRQQSFTSMFFVGAREGYRVKAHWWCWLVNTRADLPTTNLSFVTTVPATPCGGARSMRPTSRIVSRRCLSVWPLTWRVEKCLCKTVLLAQTPTIVCRFESSPIMPGTVCLPAICLSRQVPKKQKIMYRNSPWSMRPGSGLILRWMRQTLRLLLLLILLAN